MTIMGCDQKRCNLVGCSLQLGREVHVPAVRESFQVDLEHEWRVEGDDAETTTVTWHPG